MTTEQIQQKQRQEAAKFDTAVRIRNLLDEARAGLAAEADADDYETEILALVTDAE